MCPVRPDQRAKDDITVVSAGKAIGFCCNQCRNKFLRAPGAYIGNIPELKGGTAKPDDKKGDKSDDKKPDKPAASGPCEVKKTVKGYWCLSCKRELTQDDVRGALCKRCETKPEEIEYCLKLIPKPIQVKGGKPLPPEFDEDKGRISYVCEKCSVKGDIESQLKHKEDCKPGFGSGFKKVCAKSGKAPHVSD
jgi:hypothetical protein